MKRVYVMFAMVVLGSMVFFSGCAKKAVKTELEGAALEKVEAQEKQEEKEAVKPEIERPVVVEEIKKEEVGREIIVKKEIKDVFFDYDSYAIRDDARTVLEENAGILKADKKAFITLEGHADERGAIEYNIALGERRAEAAKKYLVNLNIAEARIKTISYGKEKPACLEHTEECWQRNRRVHFVISY